MHTKLGLLIVLSILSVSLFTQTGFATDRKQLHEERLAGLHRVDYSGRNAAISSAASFDDLQVSRSVSPSRFTQDNSDVVRLKDGGWLTVWEDNRLGRSSVYSQELSDLGALVGFNELMAGSAVGADLVDPKLAVDTLGRVYFFYRDRTNGLIFGSRFLSDMTPDLAEFQVNDTTSSSFAGPFDVAVFPDGTTVVVWEDYSPGGNTIEMRIYGPSGSSTFGPSTVNSDASITSRWVPSVAVSPGSGFLVVWEDYRNGQADIYTRQFLGSGTAVGNDFAIVPPASSGAEQYLPTVTFSDLSEYVIAWIDERDGFQRVYAQQYDGSLGLIDGNVQVSDSDALTLDWGVSLASSPNGSTAVLWSRSSGDNSIAGVILDDGLVVLEGPTALNGVTSGDRWLPSVAFDPDGVWGVIWTEVLNTDRDVVFQQFNQLSSPDFSPEVAVNDDVLGAPSVDPDIAKTSDWYSLYVWSDQRRDEGDIYVKAIGTAGVAAHGDTPVSQDAGLNLQSEPAVHYDGSQGLIVWVDSRNVLGVSGQRIFGRYCGNSGVLQGDEFQISDSGAIATKSSPKVVLDTFGRALVVWLDRRSGLPEVYGQWLEANGTLSGSDFLISEDVADTAAASLTVANIGGGEYMVTWLEIGTATPVIKGRAYSFGTMELNFVYAPSIGAATLSEVAADLRGDGNLSMAYVYSGAGVTEVAQVVLTPLGVEVNSPQVLTAVNTGEASALDLAVSDENYTAIVWLDRRDGITRLYRRILDASNTPLDSDGAVSSATPTFMGSPAVDAARGRAWYAWEDPRNEGVNIWSNVEVYLPTDVEDDDPLVPTDLNLSQNYPNPFNPETRISFWLPSVTELRLDVINMLGQHVTTLAEGSFTPGEHQVVWDGTNSSGERVASGIYFYRLVTSDVTETRKMLLLK